MPRSEKRTWQLTVLLAGTKTLRAELSRIKTSGGPTWLSREAPGLRPLNLSGGTPGWSEFLAATKHHLEFQPDVTFGSTISVIGKALHDWSVANNVGKIDFVWLDMQGVELEVLETGPKC